MENVIHDKEHQVSARKRDVIPMLPNELQRAEVFTIVPQYTRWMQEGQRGGLSKIKGIRRNQKGAF